MTRFTITHTVLAGFLLCFTPMAGQAQNDPGFGGLAYLAQTDPDQALERIETLLAETQQSDDSDPRVVFDLYRLAADLLIEADRTPEAARIVAQLAQFATRFRPVLDRDPAPLFAEASTLFEATGDLRSARDAARNLVEEQRDGALPDAVIAQSQQRVARLSEAMGEPSVQPLGVVPKSGTRGDTEGFREVDVYYATDRARSGDPAPTEFYGKFRGELELGIATVTVPESHTPGVLEAPSIWRLEFRTNPAKHVVLQSVEPLDPASFYGRLQGEFRDVPEREAFVFIHGYNVRFDQAARRAAQIAYDMNYVGVPILYSWPSRGSTVGYVADTAVVRLSGRRLTHFLDDLVAKSGAETIHIVAHSMGNRALTDALELMALRRGLKEGDAPVFGQVLFAAPDVDAGLFREMLPTIRPIAQRLTLYASEEDWALTTSRKLHGDAPRAGLGGEYTLSDPTIDSIDMSELGDDMLAHSYFADDSSALADMMTLFWQNTAPQNRCGLETAASEGTVWRYRRGICSDRNLIDVMAHMRRENVVSMDQARAVLKETVEDADLAFRLETVMSKIVGN